MGLYDYMRHDKVGLHCLHLAFISNHQKSSTTDNKPTYPGCVPASRPISRQLKAFEEKLEATSSGWKMKDENANNGGSLPTSTSKGGRKVPLHGKRWRTMSAPSCGEGEHSISLLLLLTRLTLLYHFHQGPFYDRDSTWPKVDCEGRYSLTHTRRNDIVRFSSERCLCT